MTLPYELVLVRHGQSEGNAAKRLSEKGDHSAYSKEFRERHTSSFRLTRLGREQARDAGKYLHHEFYKDGYGFDRFYTSEYIRAMETSACLRLQNAKWYADPYLTERDWGDLDISPEDEREAKFGEALKRQAVEPFFWRPPNGESFNNLCHRVDRVLDRLHRECQDKRVIIVCHGEVMWAFRVRLERMSQVRFRDLHRSKNPDYRIHNCQIIQYSRRNPETGRLAKYANWMRMVRPTHSWDDHLPWEEIERPVYSNDDLLRIVEDVPAMVA